LDEGAGVIDQGQDAELGVGEREVVLAIDGGLDEFVDVGKAPDVLAGSYKTVCRESMTGGFWGLSEFEARFHRVDVV